MTTYAAGSDLQNLVNVGKYLMAHGYSKAAAAGIAGTIAGESGGNPESVGSGGNGLIGWTPPKPGIVTGNATADLNKQMADIVAYNNQNDPTEIGKLDAETNPVAAADFYSQIFERPAVKDSDVRPSIANEVFKALGGTPVTDDSSPGGIGADIFSGIGTDLVNGLLKSIGVSSLSDLVERATLIGLGLLFVIFGIIKITGGPDKHNAPDTPDTDRRKDESSTSSDETPKAEAKPAATRDQVDNKAATKAKSRAAEVTETVAKDAAEDAVVAA
jgi:hypothetical protein